MPDTPIIFANLGFAIVLLALMFRDILWLRIVSVLGTLLIVPMYIFATEVGWTSLGWNSAGIIINLVQIVILILARRPLVLKGIEKQIHGEVFYALNPRTYHRIFQLAQLEKYQKETILIEKGEVVHNLYLIVSGQIKVILSDGTPKVISNNTFIGEQAFITGESASATVSVLSEEAAILKWENIELHKLLDKSDVTLSNTFDLILTTDIIHKLRRMAD